MKIPVNTQLTGTLNTNQNSVQFLHKQFIKHCQRHNGPRVLTLATCIGSKFGQLYVVPLVLVGGATRIGSKFGQHVMQFALVPILATLLCILIVTEEEEASCLVRVDEVDVQNHDGKDGEA